ncbi:MAG: hypothetical protein OER96_10605, partial [Gammaproteobacteria bacterium]|nr:hypothetical protein [Gammaproteobacteria bacterium]
MNLNDVVIKCFRISERTVVSVTNALNSTNQGLWLGLLNRDQLSRISELQYADWKRYQQREWNIFGLYHWEEQVIDKYFSGCESLLIGAVGGGREVYALMNRGMDIDAFECNPNLIKYCRELLSGEEFKGKIVQSMPDEVPESLGLYSGMILGWGAYIHIHGQLNRIRFLNQCRAHLVSDGNLLLSFLTREGATRSLRWTYTIARLI